MKKTLLILFVLFVSVVKLLAQENLVNGYIITNSNDTIYGLVDLRTPSVNQERCVLVTNDSQKQTYLPGDIKAYRYSDIAEMYVSKNVEVNGQEYLIFAEYLVQGGLSLFYFEHDKQSYYIFEEEEKLPLYITKKLPIERDYKIMVDWEYRALLKYHFREQSENLKTLIEKSEFNQKAMIAIVKQYNDENCLNPDQASCIVFENEALDKLGLQLKFSAYIGIQSATYLGYLSKGNSIFPLIGGQMYVYNPRWSNSFGGVVDLSLSKINKKQSKVNKEVNKEWFGSLKSVDYDMFNLSSKIGLRYTYSKHRFRPSVEAGFGTAYLFKNNSNIIYSAYGNEHMKEAYDVRKFHVVWYIGAGFEYNITKDQYIFVRFNYDRYLKSFLKDVEEDDQISLWQLKVGYTF